ncbi:MAG: M14 family metallocarboxypeptidase [Phycisphaerales bacterium]
MRTTSQAQLDSVLEIAADVWSERIGIGVLELQLDRDQLGRLSAIGVPYDILIEDLQAHADAHAADMRAIRQREATQTPDESRRVAGVHDDSWFATYRTLDEISQYCENLALQRPELASISTIGQSWEGRDMFSITISGPDTVASPVNERPALFIFSTVHAREWIAPMTTCYIASKLVSDYDTDDQVRMLLDHARVVVVPVGNPDGYLYTWSVERYWRKSRRDNGDGNFGVDINRNWGYEWGGSGSSGQTGSNTYRGTAPFSEPETQALRDVALGLGQSLVAHIDYHSYSQLVLWPYGYADGVITPEPYASELQAVSGCIADTIFSTTGAYYNPIQSVDLYPAAGDSSDWFFGELARMSFTIELRTRNSFSPPPSEIRPCGRENYEAFLVVMDKAARHHRYLHQPMQQRELFDERWVRLHPFANAEVIDDSSLTLMTRIGTSGTFSALPMSIESPNVFTAELPEGMCGDQVQYYFRLSEVTGQSRPSQKQGKLIRTSRSIQREAHIH